MRLFVTGGSGFIGSHFLHHAIAEGHDVVALRRIGSRPRIPLEFEPNWIEGELDADHALHFKGVDVFVHLASHTANPPYAPLEACLYWNVYAPIKLARQAVASGVSRFLVAGSCFEYGAASAGLPAVSPDTPLRPTLSYPTSKAAGSLAFEGFAREHKVQLKILRIFQVYGEGEQPSRLWPSLRRAALAGEDFPMSPGGQLRDFVDVTSVASQFVEHLDFSVEANGEPTVHHVASGHARTLLEFAEYWWTYWGARGRLLPGAYPYRPHELMRLASNLESIRRQPAVKQSTRSE